MADEGHLVRLAGLGTPRGEDWRELDIGPWIIGLDGLNRSLGRELDERWGPFVRRSRGGARMRTLRLLDAGERGWLPGPEAPGERYRMEAHGEGSSRLIVSYNFAVARTMASDDSWSLGITRDSLEPPGRMVENAVRFLLAVLALDQGGFAMHSAGVVHDGRAYIYAGPSRSGKSTAVAASTPAGNLGDDFGIVVRGPDGWWTPAVPFDGSERVATGAPRGAFPVGAIWRLYHGPEVRIDHPSSRVASASLLSCAAFPWAYPERAGELLDHVRRFVDEGRFGHLQFARDSNLYTDLLQRQSTSP